MVAVLLGFGLKKRHTWGPRSSLSPATGKSRQSWSFVKPDTDSNPHMGMCGIGQRCYWPSLGYSSVDLLGPHTTLCSWGRAGKVGQERPHLPLTQHLALVRRCSQSWHTPFLSQPSEWSQCHEQAPRIPSALSCFQTLVCSKTGTLKSSMWMMATGLTTIIYCY